MIKSLLQFMWDGGDEKKEWNPRSISIRWGLQTDNIDNIGISKIWRIVRDYR